MSGGSFDYLFSRDAAELLESNWQLDRMAVALAELGYAEDAARETEELLLIIRAARVRIEARADRLRDVWQAVEWWTSCDSSEDAVREALAKYRDGV